MLLFVWQRSLYSIQDGFNKQERGRKTILKPLLPGHFSLMYSKNTHNNWNFAGDHVWTQTLLGMDKDTNRGLEFSLNLSTNISKAFLKPSFESQIITIFTPTRCVESYIKCPLKPKRKVKSLEKGVKRQCVFPIKRTFTLLACYPLGPGGTHMFCTHL